MPYKVVDTFWQCEVDHLHKHKTEKEALTCERKRKFEDDLDNIDTNRRFENTSHGVEVEEAEECLVDYEPQGATSIEQVMVVRTTAHVRGCEINTYRRKVQEIPQPPKKGGE